MTNTKITQCTVCEKEVSKKAKNCPHCGENNPAKRTSTFTWIVAGLFGLTMVSTLAGGGTPSTKTHYPTEIDAAIACKDFVEKSLKSPSSAKFPIVASKARSLGTGKYALASYVDAQNTYGAMIRTNFQCIVYYHSEKNFWELMQLKM